VSVGGSYNYSNTGGVTSGSFSVGASGVGGGGTIPGVSGGSATVSVNVQQFLFWTFGTVTVADPGAGLPYLTGYVLFGPAPSSHVTAFGFSFDNFQFKTYTINVNIT